MLDRLIDFIISLIEDILPCVIIPVFNKALLLRAGKSYRVLEPGFHWKIPFIDKPHEHTVVTTTLNIPVQSLITSDHKQLAVKAVAKYNIEDVQKHVEAIYDAVDAISDLSQGRIMKIINAKTLEECIDVESVSNEVTIAVRREVKKYGIYIEQITLTDLVETPSYRLFMDGSLCTT